MVNFPTAGAVSSGYAVNPRSDKEEKDEEEAEDDEEFLEPTLSPLSDKLSRPSAPPRTTE